MSRRCQLLFSIQSSALLLLLLLLGCYNCWELPRSSPLPPVGWNYQQQAKKKFLINHREKLQTGEGRGEQQSEGNNRYIEIVYDVDRNSYVWLETTTDETTTITGDKNNTTGRRASTQAKRFKMDLSEVIEDNYNNNRIRRRT
eukprot:GHVS01057998.1.p1 GENE.GHVS01057998.1~~GHVS01057998.1.p1  ORF type:complete len:143 (+),score=43.42 GHVS01057998.1:358-786(+)